MHIPLDIGLTTERLSLRAADLSDVDLIWEVSRFSGFNDGMTWDPPDNRAEIAQVVEKNRAGWKQGTNYIFTVALKSSGQAFGCVGLKKEDAQGIWSIGFWVHPNHWGNGFAKEAAEAVIAFGFERLKAKRIVTEHAIWNKRSKRVIEKLGFTYMRENPEGFYKGGKPVPQYEYELSGSA